jgi:ABC-2 type transport system permease protein
LTGFLARVWVVASTAFRASFAGSTGYGVIAAAATYPIIVAGIASAHFAGLDLLATSELLFSTLFLPVILLLVCLILGVGTFRGELEEDTLVYPLNRTVPRPALVFGKYLGFAGAALTILMPAALLGVGLASAVSTGPTVGSPALVQTVVVLTVLAVLTYGAFFLLLGLLTRQALVFGLLYGFIWETFISVVAGPIRTLTIVYHLRGIAAQWMATGPFSGGPTGESAMTGILGLLASAVGCLIVAVVYLQRAEIRPAAAPA